MATSIRQLESWTREALAVRDPTTTATHVHVDRMFLTWITCSMFYGCIMGAYGGFSDDRYWQVIYSAIKVPLLSIATFGLALPFLFVVASLWGLRHYFSALTGALIHTQTGISLVLASFAPLTAVWYSTAPTYHSAILFNLIMFGFAYLSGQYILRRNVMRLVQREPRLRRLLFLWIVLVALLGIQMGWILRPFIGQPDVPTVLFRNTEMGNAYVALWHTLTQVFRFD